VVRNIFWHWRFEDEKEEGGGEARKDRKGREGELGELVDGGYFHEPRCT